MRRFINALFLVFLLSVAFTPAARADQKDVKFRADSPSDLIHAVNALRVSYGIAPYAVNPILMAAAQGHADFMAATGSVSHTGAGGSSVTDRLLALGYPLAGDLSLGGFRSENITSGREGMTAQEAVDRWTGDALHLNTMISPDLTEMGAGVTVNNGRVYFVVDCARPTDSGLPQDAGPPAANESTVIPGAGGVIIPVVSATPNADGDVIHEVRAGQSLWQIAISYDTRIDEIRRLNNLADDKIFPGMKLLVKQGLFPMGTLPAVLIVETTETALPPTLAATLTMPETSGETVTPTAVPPPSGNTMTVVIGILVLAVLGGGIFAWWGSRRR